MKYRGEVAGRGEDLQGKFLQYTIWATLDDKRFSAMGDILWDNGGESGGQCHETLAHLAPVQVALWRRWHLNDMRAGCEHQRAEGWGQEEVEVIEYGLTREAHVLRGRALIEAAQAAQEGRVARLTPAGLFLIGPDWFKKRWAPPGADDPESGLFEVRSRTMQWAGHVYPPGMGKFGGEEHPRGVLTQPCPVCGYRYGSAWLVEEIPPDARAEIIAAFNMKPEDE